MEQTIVCFLQKTKFTRLPSYSYELIPKSNDNYKTRNVDHIDPFYCRTDMFKYSFFLYANIEWSKLDANLKNS